MTKANGDYGKEGKDARKLLERGGLTKDVVNAARALLGKVSTIEKHPPPPDLEEERRKLKTAEDAMWGWDLEWGTIARNAIKERGLLRQLGFLAASRGRAGEEEVVEPVPGSADGGSIAADEDEDVDVL